MESFRTKTERLNQISSVVRAKSGVELTLRIACTRGWYEIRLNCHPLQTSNEPLFQWYDCQYWTTLLP